MEKDYEVSKAPLDAFMQQNNKLDAEYNLPGTADRTGKWWYAAFHNITAIVGAGVLGLPFAMSYLTWYGGVVIMVLSWVTSLYTLWQLVELHEFKGHRFNRYHELGQYAFGPRLGLWLVIPFQLIVMIGLAIVYMVTGGKSMQRVYRFQCSTPGSCPSFGLSCWILVFAGIQFVLSQLPNFNSLRIVSLSAAVMSLGYSTIAIGTSISNGKQPGAAYNLDGHSVANSVFGIFNALGTIAFAYGGHNVVLEIQATMPSPPATAKPYMRGVYIAYAVVSWCYFGVTFAGYWAFGNKVADNILFSLDHPVWLISMASIMVLIHVIGSYQVYSMPVFDMIETYMVKHGLGNGVIARLVYRSCYVALTAFVAITLPFFGDLLGFIGAFAFGPTTFTIPPVIWLILKKPPVTSAHWWACWFCIIYGVITTVLGSIGGMRGIIVDASTYHFYS